MGKTKYIFVTGGVVSGLGKGITAASLGRLLKNRGYKITIQKFDPYINIDPGTMNPIEHGEVFVTDDGAETDLDLGHYERFIDENLTKNSSITMGKIYSSVLEKERRGEYLGKTVQVIPHITNEIKEKIYSFENTDTDIVITEVGGTIGDIEGISIIEAIRQIGLEQNPEDVIYIHVTLLPYIFGSNEIKTKPTQHSVKELQSLGIKPDIVVCRTETELSESIREKIALFCNVRKNSVIQNMTAGNLYEIPLMLEKEGLAREVCNHLRLESFVPDNNKWVKMIEDIKSIKENETVKIAIVGKYIQLEDSYLSLIESVKHAGYKNKVKTEIKLIDSKTITETNIKELLDESKALIVSGGFGEEGNEGELVAIKYARENKMPYLGICLGMQMTVIEYARNVLGLKDADSVAFNQNALNPVIHLPENHKEICKKDGTLRLGAYDTKLKEGTIASEMYEKEIISERHRHKYEYNKGYKEKLEEAGLICSGTSLDENLVEIVEISRKEHPYFVATIFHPEYKSRPNNPASLFVGLIDAAKKQ